MAWFIPLAGSLVFYPWERGLKWMAVLAFSTLLLALMLGQSRAAILGVIPALIVLVLLWVRRPRNRYLALLGIGFLIVVQWAVLVNVFPAIGVRAFHGFVADAGLEGDEGNFLADH